jgi:hypothetical protein
MGESPKGQEEEPKERAGGSRYRHSTLARTSPSKIAAVLAMDQLGIPRAEIARREKMGKDTLYVALKQGQHVDQRIVEQVKKNIAAHFWVSAERSLQHITDDKLEKASANALMWTAGVATDKALLLEGKPTQRIEYQGTEDRDAAARIEELEAELDGWKDGSVMNVEGSLEGEGVPSPTE